MECAYYVAGTLRVPSQRQKPQNEPLLPVPSARLTAVIFSPKRHWPVWPGALYHSDMTQDKAAERRRLEGLDARALVQHQLVRLNALLDRILPDNAFYAGKLGSITRPITSLDQLATWPFTYKQELIGSPGRDLAQNRTWPLERYARFHRTSGTHGRPLGVLDTAEDWRWWLECWQFVLDAAEVTSEDRALMAFSFGPFVGLLERLRRAGRARLLVDSHRRRDARWAGWRWRGSPGPRSSAAPPATRCTWPRSARRIRSTSARWACGG